MKPEIELFLFRLLAIGLFFRSVRNVLRFAIIWHGNHAEHHFSPFQQLAKSWNITIKKRLTLQWLYFQRRNRGGVFCRR